MTTRQLAGVAIDVNPEGFLTNAHAWTREVAQELAKEEQIELTERHWKVIDFIRKDGEETGEAPTIRRLAKVGGVNTKDMYELFPGGPAKKAAKIAGYPKPHGCI
jgi:tRNA 2-thiouridine synthesizing protein E